MAGDTDILSKIVEAAASLDEAAYVTHANVGLLRRARKEMEKGTVATVVNVAADKVELAVGDCTVVLSASGLAGATCSCSAAGKCWHVLLACLQLAGTARDVPPAPEVEETEDEWLALTEARLRKWAGAENFRKASKLALDDVKTVEPPEVVFAGDVRCRLVPRSGRRRMPPRRCLRIAGTRALRWSPRSRSKPSPRSATLPCSKTSNGC
jgi:hypothetical protein